MNLNKKQFRKLAVIFFTRMKKIAFCFLIYDTINHEELWNNFFKNVDPAKYNIYIHYKYNKQLTVHVDNNHVASVEVEIKPDDYSWYLVKQL